MTVWFRLKSFWKVLRGDQRWGAMTREGFAGARVSIERPAVS
jgi:hypothetical protein